MMLKLVLATCLVASTLGLHSDWTQANRDAIVAEHNKLRKNEGACQMNKLNYDMQLEAEAKVWANKCVFEHENIDGRGENLAWNSNALPEQTMIDAAMKGWFDEKLVYSYGQKSCARSCHYTQLVNSKTSKIGCWSTRCPNLVHAYKNAWFLVCFYREGGNIYGQKPYDKQCDAPCRKGQTEENGLCVGEWIDEKKEAEEACDDKHDECSRWAEDKQCEVNPVFMMKNCRLSCTECGPKPTVACVDGNPSCPKWAARSGECDRNKNYMHKHCRKSCQLC